MKKTVIIAAAGSGSRLGFGLPKCLVKIGGHAIFEYQLKAFEWADEIRMVVGCASERVIQEVAAINSNIIFVNNIDFANTSTLQSNFLGAINVEGNALFIDGDMIISKKTAGDILQACDSGEMFVGVSRDISSEPVYAGVKEEKVCWFSYDKTSEFEWANVAFWNARELEYKNTHFYVQLEKRLPIKSVLVDRLEVDTPEDFRYVQDYILSHKEKYDFWRE